MQILTVDVGTGTQDILLYDSRVDLENSFKLVVPSPTMIVHRHIREATRRGDAILLTGVTMGGGPSHWAARDHAHAGYAIYATPDAARTFDDNLDLVIKSGIQVVSEDEAYSLAKSIGHIVLQDFDFELIAQSFERFGVSMKNLGAVAVAVFDHGAAPPKISDRQFRFDYLDERIRKNPILSTFAFLQDDVPSIMTRLGAVITSASGFDAPLMVMDTAPAAILGASFDPLVRARNRVMIAN
ncbi:MAG: pyruvate formate lyase-activating protein, partial [Anaerolineae bacterium]|nr:pyruvate formate lyase-activating protein [Anaerolineae bacterium]